jgi:cytochrome c oxidase cbb3-type subunit 1
VNKLSVTFVKLSLIYLLLAAGMGVLMIFLPEFRASIRYAHMHLMLLGWMNMMVFGVAYHVLPRFMGNPLFSEKLAWGHLVLGNIGLVGLVLFETLPYWVPGLNGTPAKVLAGVFGSIELVSFVCFVVNLWMSMRTRPAEYNPFAAPGG